MIGLGLDGMYGVERGVSGGQFLVIRSLSHLQDGSSEWHEHVLDRAIEYAK